jgi:hypothetical protein
MSKHEAEQSGNQYISTAHTNIKVRTQISHMWQFRCANLCSVSSASIQLGNPPGCLGLYQYRVEAIFSSQ